MSNQQIKVRAVWRDEIDLNKLVAALLLLVREQRDTEKDAEARPSVAGEDAA